jgi:hypothetical protein
MRDTMTFNKFFFKIMEDYLGVPLHIKVEEADLVDVIVKEVSL